MSTKICVEFNDIDSSSYTAIREFNEINSTSPYIKVLSSLGGYVNKALGGFNTVNCTVGVGQAYATLTFAGQPTADQTVVVNGYTFTAKDSGASGPQFNIDATVSGSVNNLFTVMGRYCQDGVSESVKLSKVTVSKPTTTSIKILASVAGEAGNGYTVVNTMSNVTPADFGSSGLAGADLVSVSK